MPTSPSPELGDIREDGFVCKGKYTARDGTRKPLWLSPTTVFRKRLSGISYAASKRAEELGLPFNITVAHLEEIFPTDGLCPVLRTPLVQGDTGGKDNSPSLDRREPCLGYVIGNVGFISNRANQLKGALTLVELERLVSHVKGQLPRTLPSITTVSPATQC